LTCRLLRFKVLSLIHAISLSPKVISIPHHSNALSCTEKRYLNRRFNKWKVLLFRPHLNNYTWVIPKRFLYHLLVCRTRKWLKTWTLTLRLLLSIRSVFNHWSLNCMNQWFRLLLPLAQNLNSVDLLHSIQGILMVRCKKKSRMIVR
jgi:hypothetical protein